MDRDADVWLSQSQISTFEQNAVFHPYCAGSRRMADEIGADYPDLAWARVEAIRGAREIVAETLRRGGAITPDCLVEIADAEGRVLDMVSIEAIATEAAVADAAPSGLQLGAASVPAGRTGPDHPGR